MALGYRTENQSIAVQHHDGTTADLLCVSLILDRNDEEEKYLSHLLQSQLNKLDSSKKIALIYRSPLQNRKSIQAAITCFSTWLSENPKTYTTSYYRDEFNWIECRTMPSTRFLNHDIVQIVQESLCSDILLNKIDIHCNAALEQIRLNQFNASPVLLSIVSNQLCRISENSWRFFLYGPTSTVYQNQYRQDANQMRGWLHDPFRTFLSGVLKIECSFDNESNPFEAESFENPWSEFKRFAPILPSPKLQLLRKENLDPILEWN